MSKRVDWNWREHLNDERARYVRVTSAIEGAELALELLTDERDAIKERAMERAKRAKDKVKVWRLDEPPPGFGGEP